MSSPAERLGLVALGDSITVGDGEPALGVSCRPWALWLARALELLDQVIDLPAPGPLGHVDLGYGEPALEPPCLLYTSPSPRD